MNEHIKSPFGDEQATEAAKAPTPWRNQDHLGYVLIVPDYSEEDAREAAEMHGADYSVVGLSSVADQSRLCEHRLILAAETPEQALSLHEDLVARGLNDKALRMIVPPAGLPLEDYVMQPSAVMRDCDGNFVTKYWRTTRQVINWGPVEHIQTESPGMELFADTDIRLSTNSGELVVVVGGYGSGKSTFAQMLALNFARRMSGEGIGNKWKVLVHAWEDNEAKWRARMAAAMTNGAILTTGEQHRDLERHESQALAWFQDNAFWCRASEVRRRGVEEYFAELEHSVETSGVKLAVLDPWNEMDHEHDSYRNESNYTNEMLGRAQRLALDLGIILIITGHVTKSAYADSAGQLKPFRIHNAFGSNAWGNKASRGFCVARTQLISQLLHADPSNSSLSSHLLGVAAEAKREFRDHYISRHSEHTIIVHDKAKSEDEMGKKQVIAAVFQPATNRYRPCLAASRVAQAIWPIS